MQIMFKGSIQPHYIALTEKVVRQLGHGPSYVEFVVDEDLNGMGLTGVYNPILDLVRVAVGRSVHDVEHTLVHELRHVWQYKQVPILYRTNIAAGLFGRHSDTGYAMSWVELDADVYAQWYLGGMEGPLYKVPTDWEIFEGHNEETVMNLLDRYNKVQDLVGAELVLI